MSKNDLISVIIPTHNYAKFLSGTLDNILEQTFTNFEIIVVDDGSTDQTSEVVEPYLSKNVKYIIQRQTGVSAARNRGIQESRGNYIQFLDADDLLGRSSLEDRLRFLQNNTHYHIAVCSCRLFNRLVLKAPMPLFFSNWPVYPSHLDVHLFYCNVAPIHSYLFRRHVITETGWFNETMTACEDYDFWIRALTKGFKPAYCRHGRVYYRKHPESSSSNQDLLHYFDAVMNQRLCMLLETNEYLSHHPLRLEMIIAFLAGTLRTLSFIRHHNQLQTPNLHEIFSNGVKMLEAYDHLNNKASWNWLIHYYYLHILSYLSKLTDNCKDFSYTIETHLLPIAERLKAPSSLIALLRTSLSEIFLPGNANYLERYRIFKTTAQLLL